MPVQERVCPACQHLAGTADSYCSSCGTVLRQGAREPTNGWDPAASDYRPLVLSRPVAPPELQPLQIVPDNSRQRRRMMKRGVALLLTVAIIGVFALSLVLLADRRGNATVQALMIVSGLLAIVALGAWVNFGVRRARKRARRQPWQMSAS